MSARQFKQYLRLISVGLILAGTDIGFAHAISPWDVFASGNHVAIIRHALAPGYSDPDHFDLKNCKTQRNLNHEGRLQSERIGALFRLNGISQAIVYSSQWCRCLETAALLDFGEVIELPVLNSFFENFERKDAQTQELRRWMNEASLKAPTILITHQVNILALTGYSASSGEIIFVERNPDGSVTVVGKISTLP